MDPKPVADLDAVEFQLQTSWSAGHPYYKAWSLGPLTYAIASSTPVAGSSKWQAMTADQVAAAQESFAIWSELIGIPLIAAADQSKADITFSYSTDVPNTASGQTVTELGPQVSDPTTDPVFPITHADVMINATAGTNASGTLTPEKYGPATFLHEIGHALGLSHPGNYDATDTAQPTYAANAVYAQDSNQYTIMSYFGSEATTGWDVTTNRNLNPSTPMLDDIVTIQSKYGANLTTRATDTTYGYHSNAGWDFFDFTTNKTPVFTIYDAGGNDTIDASEYPGKQTIDLRPGTFSSVLGYTDNIAIAYDVSLPGDASDLIENADGGGGDDTITGNAGVNVLVGNGGDDVLDGLGGGETTVETADGSEAFGADRLTGGTGADTFVYSTGYRLVTVTDFEIGKDRLDLSNTGVHDWQTLLTKATQVGPNLVIEFAKGSRGINDDLTLQNVSLADFQAMDASKVTFSPDPAPVFGGFDVLPNPDGDFTTEYAYVAPLAGGGFAALRDSVAEVGSQALFVYRYDAHGAPIDRVQVNTVPWDGSSMSMIGLGSGRILAVWDTTTGGSNGGPAIRGRLLDASGNPIGSDFVVNNTPSDPAIGRTNWRVSLTPSPGGGATLDWTATSSLAVSIYEGQHLFRNGIDADGNVVSTDKDLGLWPGYHLTEVFAIPETLSYYMTTTPSTHYNSPYPDWHAWYELVDSGMPVEIDRGDFIPDPSGASSPSFNAIELTDGRVLFQYASGYTTGYSERVNAEKIIILDPATGGFTKPGTDGPDVLQGGKNNDQLYGLGGDDTLQGNGGADLLDGGPGTDTADYALSP